MKTIDILGIKIKDYSVRETLHLTREYLSHNVPSTVCFLTREDLLGASESAEWKSFIEEEADATMIASSDIFKAAGVEEKGRAREIDRNLYLKGLMRLLSKERRRLYLLTQNPTHMYDLKYLLGTFESALQVAGSCDSMEMSDPEKAVEDVTNDINTVTPDVIFAVLLGDQGIRFVNLGKKYMNARLIVLMQPELLRVRDDGSVKKGFAARLSERLFAKIAGRYR